MKKTIFILGLVVFNSYSGDFVYQGHGDNSTVEFQARSCDIDKINQLKALFTEKQSTGSTLVDGYFAQWIRLNGNELHTLYTKAQGLGFSIPASGYANGTTIIPVDFRSGVTNFDCYTALSNKYKEELKSLQTTDASSCKCTTWNNIEGQVHWPLLKSVIEKCSMPSKGYCPEFAQQANRIEELERLLEVPQELKPRG